MALLLGASGGRIARDIDGAHFLPLGDVTLRAEDYALLFGAVGLFAVLAAIIYLTRRIDWYAVRLASVNRA